MGKKGKGKKKAQSEEGPSQQQQQQQGPPEAQGKKTGGPQQQQQRGPPEAQQQQQGPPVPQQQQQRPPVPQQQQQGQPGAWQQRAPVPQQQQQRPPTPQQQQQGPPGAWQQRAPVPQQQQQRPPVHQQQQGGQPGAWQQRAPVPQQQQQRPPVHQQQQGGQPGAWQQRAPVPQQQQQRPPVYQQQQGGQPVHQQQQGGQPGTWQQRAPVPQQQQQRPPTPQQQQQRQPTPQQQQQGPPGAWQQRAPVPQQQQQRPPTPQQQQQGPPGAWQQRAPMPQQQQQGPPGAWQQRAPMPQQQQQRPPTPQQQQQRQPTPQQQQQGPPTPQQQQQRQPTPQQQQQGPPGAWQQRVPVPQQQQQRPPTPQQQQQRQPTPQQQQQRQPTPQQHQQGSSAIPGPQKQKPPSEPVQQQQWQMSTYCGNSGKLSNELNEKYLNQIPKRRSLTGGIKGDRITVETNMLKINFNDFKPYITHYDVVIEPDKPKFLLRPVFEAYRKMYFATRYPAFDGRKNAYSSGDLPFGEESPREEVKVYDNERKQERTFKVYLKRAAFLDLTWLKNVKCGFADLVNEQQGLQALDIILRHGAASTSINVGRSLFQPPEGRVVSLSNGLDLWVGIFQSAVVGWKPYLNIDVAHKGFPTPQSIIDLMKDLCKPPNERKPLENITPNNVEYNREKITKFLKGLKVQYEIPGQPNSKRTYRVNELVACARRNQFALENGQMCTVEQYFAEQKKFRLRYPELPCLWVGSRTNQRRIHLPVELCTIVAGQVTQKKMDENQTSTMIRYAATDTRTRKQKIMNGFTKMRINDQPTLAREFNLSVNRDFEKVPARVLTPPELRYFQTQGVKVSKGQWKAHRFLITSSLADNEWTILNLDTRTQECVLHDELQRMLREVGRSICMNIGRAQTPFVCLNSQNVHQIKEYFNEKKKQNIKLVVVIISSFDNAYSVVKQYSELKTPGGMVTQVIKGTTLKRLSPPTITNILLKINSKLNGVNHQLKNNPVCLETPCMLVGADVTHPAPDSTDTPSIAAVAASYNPSGFQYNIELRLQPPREEMILDLEEIMMKQLMSFYRNTNQQKPQKIIFYRDGVSEGQLTQVMHYEISAIKRAIARMGNGQTKIPITFLVVQKRHHTRFFPTDPKNSDDRNMNVQAGTVVDTEITHPTQIDFYLVSHASIQGTARPTKYRCIANEIGLTEDEIEQLTYYLCHMFARCTRSVSYPAPTYYAHLAAFRARALIQGVRLNIDDLPNEQRTKMTLQMQNSPMFFV